MHKPLLSNAQTAPKLPIPHEAVRPFQYYTQVIQRAGITLFRLVTPTRPPLTEEQIDIAIDRERERQLRRETYD